MKRSLVAVALFVASPALAAGLDLYIGFTGIQTAGQAKYVNSQIGSNEAANSAAARMIFTTLTVKAADGATVCSTSVEKNMVVKPAVQPLQFRVTYTPKPRTPSTLSDRRISPETQKYTLYGKFTIYGNPAQVSVANDKIEYTVEFPGGGTPSCINLASTW